MVNGAQNLQVKRVVALKKKTMSVISLGHDNRNEWKDLRYQ